jgi:hypothetical protein
LSTVDFAHLADVNLHWSGFQMSCARSIRLRGEKPLWLKPLLAEMIFPVSSSSKSICETPGEARAKLSLDTDVNQNLKDLQDTSPLERAGQCRTSDFSL